MQIPNDLLLIFEPDVASQCLLRGVADRLGCEHIETDSPAGLHDVLSMRRPTIAVLSVDPADADGASAVQILDQHDMHPPSLLVGSVGERVLASAKRAAESRGLSVLGVASRPIDVAAVENALAPYLANAPPIPVSEIENALVEHEFKIQYQPKVMISGIAPQIRGCEALIRWQHPRRGLLQPGQFLRAVEDHGLMSRVTDYVLTESIRQAGLWKDRGIDLEMVVNLSPKLVRDHAFPERLGLLLREHGFPPEQLMLDVTESPSNDDRDLILDVFTRLRILGVGLSLDNFGTGFSSLTELYRMPFSEIKVDQSLIADVSRERDARLIVRAITNLAKTLQLSACAEGIETRQMLEFVKLSGFDSAQGRFFSEALDAKNIEHLVKSWASVGPAATGRWQALEPIVPDATSGHGRPRPLQFPRGKNSK
jgi:EAL domain-containing protein (putative c-di-GMP-specific phosphodiesterase class I)